MDVRKSTIKDFLSVPNTFFVIPVYQRNFCWKQEQCRQLFDDILTVIDTGKTHFLGTICYKEEDDTRVIIDGQQRITSLMLLLKALYDASSNPTLRTEIQNAYLLNPCNNGAHKLKLKPIQRDAGVYKRLLSHYKVDVTAFTEHEMTTPLFEAFQNYRAWVHELRADGEFEDKIMHAIASLEVAEIICTSENPQEIFENLNATGMTLTNTDILRNYLLMSVPYNEQVRLYNTYWLPIEEAVTTEQMENFVSAYLVTVRQSDQLHINGKVWKINPKTICHTFRHHFSQLQIEKSLECVLADMCKYANYYKHCVFYKNTNPNALPTLDAMIYDLINVLRINQCTPLVMYLFCQLADGAISKEDITKCLQLATSYCVRHIVCGNAHPMSFQFAGSVIRQTAERAEMDGFVHSFKRAMTSGEGGYAFPTDILFEQSLCVNPKKLPTPVTKYLLYYIEKHLNPNTSATMASGSIEHIMPQTLTDTWQKYLAFNGDADIHDEKLHVLGNLTLTESNSQLSNKPFGEKQAIYSDSMYVMTADLARLSAWTSKTIDVRSAQLSQIAIKLWPYAGVQKPAISNNMYTLSDNLRNLGSQTPTSFTFLGEEVPCHTWHEMTYGVVVILHKLIPETIEQLAQTQPREINNLLSVEPDYSKHHSKIADDVWLNQLSNRPSLLAQLRQLLQLCSGEYNELSNELWFSLQEEDDDDIILS